MSKQEDALRVAEELLADIELKRLRPSEVVLKASRLARLVGRDDLIAFLGLERNGYAADGTETYWIGKAGRWADGEKKKFYTAPPRLSKRISRRRVTQ